MADEHDRLSGKIALVTGASSGIGAAVSQALAKRGVKVALAARRTDRLATEVATITEAGGEAAAFTCDVRDEASVQGLMAAVTERFGGIDILFANAGFGYRAPIMEGDTSRWKDMIDTNIYGVLLTLKYGVPSLIQRGGGHVFLLSSIAGHVVAAGGAAYSASKFAVNAIGEALRQEVSRQNVRVTLLAPGVVISEFQEVAGYAPGVIDKWLEGTPPIQPHELAQAVMAILDLPQHVSVNDFIIRPTGQVTP